MSFLNRKKVISTFLVSAFLILPTTQVFADTNTSTDLETKNTEITSEYSDSNDKGASTAYKYWRVTSSTRTGSRFVGPEIEWKSSHVGTTGNTISLTYKEKQVGSASVGISVAGSVIGASIGYTPGTQASIVYTATSNRYKAGTTVQSFYRLREDVYSIKQEEWEQINGINVNRPTGLKKTGTVYKPANPSVRFYPVGY